MKAYFGSRLSPNQTMTPDGFLVAINVPIARTGWYEYLGREIGVDTNEVVKVYRDPDEVFSPAAMASFEGKPVTNNHPSEGVDPSNASIYIKGTVSNVRRGTGSDDDLLLADLICYEQNLISDIQSGKREVSCGYECDYEPNGDGTYSQKNIVGNHVAVVDAGRAGDRVRIQDRRSVDVPSLPDDRKYISPQEGATYVYAAVRNNLKPQEAWSNISKRADWDAGEAPEFIYRLQKLAGDKWRDFLSPGAIEYVKSNLSDDDPLAKEPKELAKMIDANDHNHLTDAEIKKALQDGGRFYVLTQVDPKTLKVQGETSLQGVRNEFDQSKTPPIIVGRDGFVIDGRHRVASAKRCGVDRMDAYVPAFTQKSQDAMQNKKARDSRMTIKLPNRKPGSVTRLLAAVGLKQIAMDAEPEEIMDAVEAMNEERTKDANDFPVPVVKEPTEKDAAPEEAQGIEALRKQVEALTALVQQALSGKSEDQDPEKAIDAEIEKLQQDPDGDESQIIEPTQDEEAPVADPEDRPKSGLVAADSAAAVAFLKSMKPAIAAIKDPAEKKRVADAAIAAVKGRPNRQSNAYAQIQTGAKNKTADAQKQQAQQQDISELGREWAKKYNPHYQNRA